MAGHANAVQRSAVNLTVPKPYSIAANSVKLHFGSVWFPNVSSDSGTRNAQNSNNNNNSTPPWLRRPHGMGDAHRAPGGVSSEQYKMNKNQAAKWCRTLCANEAARDAFEIAASKGKWMSAAQIDETIERLDGAKADDLADAFFMALYAADALVPALWKRVHKPKTFKKDYVVNQPPAQLSMAKRKRIADGESEMAEVRHQSLAAYAKHTAKLSKQLLQGIIGTLSR